jgi:drug/metabolite transporter (DMT)-like permease
MPAALALLASLLWGTADYLGGTASRRLPVASVLAVSQLVALLGLLPLALVLGAYDEPRGFVLPGAAAGLCGVIGLAAFYRALALGTMGVVAPVAALGVVVPVGAGLLAGESPSPLQVGGILAALVGVVLASGPELRGGAGALPLLLAGVAALGFGAVLVLLAEGSGSGGAGAVVMTLLVMRVTSVTVLSVVLVGLASTRGTAFGVRRADLPLLVGIGVLDVGANGAFSLASQGDLISVTAVLASLYPVVTVLLARRLQAERLVGPQVPGVALALLGVVLLAGA